jgi:DNA ligase 1
MAASTPDMKLNALAQAHADLAATTSKLAKVSVLTALLQLCSPEELPIVIAAMTGAPRQGRIGVGWATFAMVDSVTESDIANSPSVHELDELIDLVATTSGPGSVAGRQTQLAAFLDRCSIGERDFVRKLFTGGLRQGALDGLMTDAVAKALDVKLPALRKALTMHGDLGELAQQVALHGGATLDNVRIQVGRALQPMLAATATSVEEALEAFGTASVEWKLDGARIQVHIDNGVVTLFTRNLNNITDRLPEVVARLSTITAESLVADGEVLGLDLDGNPAVFQDTMARVGSDEPTNKHRSVSLQPFLFDLLHLNGEDLVDLPLVERLAKLGEIAASFRVPGVITRDLTEAKATQSAALRLGHEGVMVKDARSTYDAGRRGTAWRKVKPVKTLDLVVLAAEWGHGRRTGKLSNLHLGARGATNEYVMVGKTFKGLTDTLLTWQTTELLARETHRTGITVFVRPELVVEIALDGVQRSKRYPGGVALRFARVKGYRPDRSPETADSIESVRSIGVADLDVSDADVIDTDENQP